MSIWVSRDSMKKAHVFGISFSFTMSLVFFTHAAVFYFGAYLIEQGELTFTNMFKYVYLDSKQAWLIRDSVILYY